MNAVDIYAPWSTDGQRVQRLRLYKARDLAGARAARTTGWTHNIFRCAEELAADFIWRRSTDEELRRVANAVGRMIQAGTELEHGGVRDA